MDPRFWIAKLLEMVLHHSEFALINLPPPKTPKHTHTKKAQVQGDKSQEVQVKAKIYGCVFLQTSGFIKRKW